MCVALTCEGVPVQLDEVAENVFGEAFLFRQALQQHHHLHLAHSVHTLCRHAPALPVNIWHTIKAQPQGTTRAVSSFSFFFLESQLVILLWVQNNDNVFLNVSLIGFYYEKENKRGL